MEVTNYRFKMWDDASIDLTKSGKNIYYGDYRVVLNIFKTAYFHIFGELFIDEKIHTMDPADCQSTLGFGFENFIRIYSRIDCINHTF